VWKYFANCRDDGRCELLVAILRILRMNWKFSDHDERDLMKTAEKSSGKTAASIIDAKMTMEGLEQIETPQVCIYNLLLFS
jgi:hypothetical protein